MKKNITQSKDKLDYTRDYVASNSMLKKWFTILCCGRENMSDADCSRHPIGVTTPETVSKINDMLLYRRLKVCGILKAIDLSQRSIFSISNDILDQKKAIRNMVSECLSLFNRNPDECLCLFITVNLFLTVCPMTVHQR